MLSRGPLGFLGLEGLGIVKRVIGKAKLTVKLAYQLDCLCIQLL
jgi:hypothetical protein